ncbi:hypothetical protein EON66_09895 [archaeon]|nr:MAG: hypothetical protein EON66_09895 [archaeon]
MQNGKVRAHEAGAPEDQQAHSFQAFLGREHAHAVENDARHMMFPPPGSTPLDPELSAHPTHDGAPATSLLPAYTERDAARFRHVYDAAGDLAIEDELSNSPAAYNAAMLATTAASHRSCRFSSLGTAHKQAASAEDAMVMRDVKQTSASMQPCFSDETKRLLGSLSSFRFGLQQLEQTRRQRNAMLQRDPSKYELLFENLHEAYAHTSPYAS